MRVSPLAGKPAEASMLVNVPKLVTAYYTETPDPSVPEQRVNFGSSGHRGCAFDKTFNTDYRSTCAQLAFLGLEVAE